MVAKTSVYRKLDDGLLHFVADGQCVMFCPQGNDDHITVAIGDVRFYIDRASFLQFAQQLVYNNRIGATNVLVPR